MYNLLLLLSGIFIPGVHCGYYFVTLPNMIRFGNEETVVVSVFDLQNAAVRVWLQHGEKKFSERNVIVVDEHTPSDTTVKVTEKDLFNEVVEEKPRKISICSEFNGQIQTRKLILNYQTGYLIVQTDKPIYTPQQRVNIRTLALDESMRAVKSWQVGMDIISPSNCTMARKTIASSVSGFFQHEFKLPPYPEVGMWTARAFFKGQYETESYSLFEVREYVLPTYGLTINCDVPYILQDTLNILVTVRAKYVYGKPVKGYAKLTLNLKDESGVSDYILDVNRRSLETVPDSEGSAAEFSIDVVDILNSPLLSDKEFPEGRRLEVVATVYEDATGKAEAASHDRTIFATRPYKFQFTKSKLNFRPGWEYFAKVEMLYANGQPVTRERINMKMFKDGVYESTKQVTTDSKGHAMAVVVTTQNSNTLTFVAATSDERYESERFNVTAYVGRNQIQVERVITNDDTMMMRAFTNMQGDGYTGMLFMVVSRGQIVYTKFKDSSNQVSEPIIEELQEKVSPNGRLLVFYVDKGANELVADSIKFDVEKTCRGDGLNLQTTKQQVKPGTNNTLTISGSPFSWVGLNVMDKALLLLNDKNVLRKNKMFDALESHDLGCGEGSGRNSADVFKKTGLTVLTNAVVSENDIVRNTDECEGIRRKKRDAESCHYYSVNRKCCISGKNYAKQIFVEADFPGMVNPYIKCYAKARELLKRNVVPVKCVMASFLTCRDELDTLISAVTSVSTSRGLDDESEYASELARLSDAGIKRTVRSDFRESWLFEVEQLNKDGVAKKRLSFPHTITEWMIQAVGITPDKGMCIADEIDVKAYKDFFVHLDLPYKAVRLENFDVKATIFNYGLPGDENKVANIYLEGVENLCYYNDPGKPSPRVQIELPPNSARTVSFPMVPMKDGLFPVTVTAIVAEVGIPEVDVIRKRLYVVNEGIEKQIAINVCLDPKNQREDCRNDERVIEDVQSHNERVYEIDLTLPEDSIPTTGGATAYMQSTLMDNVVKILIEGVDSLFKKPSGCGEQAMVKVAPTVYAMSYLKQTMMTKDIEIRGNQLIRDGVNYMLSLYRHPDGSYSIYQHVTSSTWLTAFVAKVFCQAKEVVDDAVDEQQDLKITIDWLKNHMNDDGSFVEQRPVNRGMMGQIDERDPSLTAFVLITLQECNIRSAGLNNTIEKAREYLEKIHEDTLRTNPFLLAISTYALALSDSPEKYKFKTLLHAIEKTDGKDKYWGNAGVRPASASSVETTAYALLAMIKFDDFKTSAYIVRWLTSQREASGSFQSTQDTVVALQALKQYSIATYSADVDLKVELLATNWEGKQLTVTAENSIVRQIVKKLPVEHDDNKLTVKVSGTGSGIMTIDLRYNINDTEEEICPFEISNIEADEIEDAPIDINIARERSCDVCGRCDEEPEQPVDYDLAMFQPTTAADPEIDSNFGRRRRAAGRKPRRTSTKTCIRFSVSSKNGKVHGMSNVIFGLETDVEVVREDLEKLLEDNPNIAMYEMPSYGKGFIVFYLNEITSEETNFIFRLKDNFEGNMQSRQPASVQVYDYYNPDQQCTQFYKTGPNRGQGVEFECDKEKQACKCLQSMCVQPVEDEIRRLQRTGKRPALKLYRYTCSPQKANYAVSVVIESVSYNHLTNQKMARGTVLKSIHKGIEKLEKDDEMSFFWNMKCAQPDVREGLKYIIIGKDGNIFKTNGTEEYRYPLMGTALVIRERPGNKVLKKYQMLMKTMKGCHR